MTGIFEPHGFCDLKQWMGSETDIVNAARISLANEVEEFGEDDIGLLNYLMREKHGSPFEQGFESWWHVRMPIFVAREWVRHRIGTSYNEESGRYVELRPDFYVPSVMRTQVGKPGRYRYEEITDPAVRYRVQTIIANASEHAYEQYQELLGLGLAREQARAVLPLNLYTEVRWKANCRSLLNFLELRNDQAAQYEIREYAKHIERVFADHLPHIHQQFVSHGRIAP